MDKKTVLPGEFLSTEEEFVPGKNTFDSGGDIFSGSIGTVETDSKTKEISVKPAIDVHKIRRGQIVYGIVSFMKETRVAVNICASPVSGERTVVTPTNAMLPVRNVSREYVEKLRDCFRIGDIVKARIEKILPGPNLDISTNHPDLGVVKAFCIRCRKPLHLFGHSLKCMSCGNTERRKLARGYLIK